MKKIGIFLGIVSFMLFAACSGETGADGASGQDGASVNADSLTSVLRGEITKELWDSLRSEEVIDSVYDSLFIDAFSQAWLDSAREALRDSLLSASYDSLYNVLYDSVYNDIYEKSVIRDLFGNIYSSKADMYSAYANQYPLMYKDTSVFHYPVPLAIAVENSGSVWHTVLVKAWIPGYSDTGSVTGFVNPDSTKIFGPELNLFPDKYLGLNAATPVEVQVRAYALDNDREILFFAESYTTNINPVQIRGAEYKGVDTDPWLAVWITPNMDSIAAIHTEMADSLPGGYGGYQLFNDLSIEESVNHQVRVVYDILTQKGITYVNNTDAGSLGQKVKYPQEVLRLKQANCLEGTLLFASILESIGIEPLIVIIPGHSFLGWRTSDGGTTYNFVETTFAWGNAPSSFEDAVKKGVSEYNEQVTAGNFTAGVSDIVDVAAARVAGIRPNDVP